MGVLGETALSPEPSPPEGEREFLVASFGGEV